ncbi:NTE family protein RssA [Rubinisphaera italica]|uniref:NTE family protein RssA n=1 Tax=Rubinisphaera italica TaxID=2527969 RepID=A0A5C5XFY8_9PLAN|nr:NTE family protein RssA [Rubinisphaera italica]
MYVLEFFHLRFGISGRLHVSQDITLALGGGGARGLAHLGVIDALTKAGYRIKRIVGVSMGSLVGALIASGKDISEIRRDALHYLLSERFQVHQNTLFGIKGESADGETSGYFAWYMRIQQFLKANSLFRRIITQPGMLPGVLLEDVVINLLEDVNIESLPIPLSIVAVDLLSGHQVVIENGSVRDAVRGSSSLPGIFPPVPFNDLLLCDTGTFCSLPARIAQSYGDAPVIAVEVNTEITPGIRPSTALEVLIRVDEIGENYWRKQVRPHASVVIRPNVAHVPWYDFSAAPRLIELGHHAAIGQMDQIKRIIG